MSIVVLDRMFASGIESNRIGHFASQVYVFKKYEYLALDLENLAKSTKIDKNNRNL